MLLQVKAAFEQGRKPVAPWKLLPAMTQAVSTMCHAHRDTQIVMQRFVAGITKAYPNHGMWMLSALVASSTPARKSAADVRAHATCALHGHLVKLQPIGRLRVQAHAADRLAHLWL